MFAPCVGPGGTMSAPVDVRTVWQRTTALVTEVVSVAYGHEQFMHGVRQVSRIWIDRDRASENEKRPGRLLIASAHVFDPVEKP